MRKLNKEIAKRNPVARDLASRKYRQRIVPAKKGRGSRYNRAEEKSRKVSLRDFLILLNFPPYRMEYSGE